MIGAHVPKVAPGGFLPKKPKTQNFRDVREACREFFNKRITVKSAWSGDFPR
jgi:hypothetical protein